MTKTNGLTPICCPSLLSTFPLNSSGHPTKNEHFAAAAGVNNGGGGGVGGGGGGVLIFLPDVLSALDVNPYYCWTTFGDGCWRTVA